MASNWQTQEDLAEIGKGITLLVTLVPKRNHALVRFKGKDEPSDEEKAAIQFANSALPFDPSEEQIKFKEPGNFLVVPLMAVKHYKDFGFTLKFVPLPGKK